MVKGDAHAVGLRVLSVFIGVFILFMGISKLAWLTDVGPLMQLLQEWRESAPPASRWYFETIAIPGAPIFARLVLFGELATSTAMILGFQVRLAATVSILMILNFHFASDVLFHYSYLINAYGLPVLGCLSALVIGGTRLPFSLSK